MDEAKMGEGQPSPSTPHWLIQAKGEGFILKWPVGETGKGEEYIFFNNWADLEAWVDGAMVAVTLFRADHLKPEQ